VAEAVAGVVQKATEEAAAALWGWIIQSTFTDWCVVMLALVNVVVAYRLWQVTDASRAVSKRMLRQMRITSFEASFFQLMNLFVDIVAVFRTGTPGNEHHGREAIQKIHDQFRSLFSQLAGQPEHFPTIVTIVNHYFNERQAMFGHYFHTLYQIVITIDRQRGIDQTKYIKILRAQLSHGELILLFYFCLSDAGAKLKQLVEAHGVLEGLEPTWLVRPEHHELVRQSAYGTAS
jgi:hypothetical protein